MPGLRAQPIIYEINAWVWLTTLSRRYGRELTLATVPEVEWDTIARRGVDAVWLMGVWQRSPEGRRITLQTPSLIADFRAVLADFRPEDVPGSPYCIGDYVVDARLGGPDALASARRQLDRRGLGLVLDFVPNHVAPDHPWIRSHPEYFIRGTRDDLAADPTAFFSSNGQVIACGRDPNFSPWIDTAQLNAYDPGLRSAVVETLKDIATQCDGVRCDMAMLLLNDIFAKTWGARAGTAPPSEYWVDMISAVRQQAPRFVFIAEAYWDLEWRLQQLGFNYCYDKRLYDRLKDGSPEDVRGHLLADSDYQRKLVRFLENHDEPRAITTFGREKERAAGVLILTLPGARLLHEGQCEGNRTKLPVQLGRRPEEPVDDELAEFYRKLLCALKAADLFRGQWQLCQVEGWPDNQTFRNLVASTWAVDDRRYLVVVNLADAHSQARVLLPWPELRGQQWSLHDLLSDSVYCPRDGDEMLHPGLYVDLDRWGFNLFELAPC